MKKSENDKLPLPSTTYRYTLDLDRISTFTQSCLNDALHFLIDMQESHLSGETCTTECTDGMCIQTCRGTIAKVVRLGASRISAGLGVIPADSSLAGMIEHTLLKPDATPEEVKKLCDEAQKFGFASVIVNPTYVNLAVDTLVGSGVRVGTVIGFPLGATLPEVKAFETINTIKKGADEIDMMINVGALKAKDYPFVTEDIQGVVEICHTWSILTKVIIETALLTNEEKVIACLLAEVAGADFIKTSSGFGPGGATLEDVALIRRIVNPNVGVKASGGIRTLEQARKVIDAGATRLGTSAGILIERELQDEVVSSGVVLQADLRR